MSRQTLSPMHAPPPVRKSLVRKARRAAAGLFWNLADGGWVLVVAGTKGAVRFRLWVATAPARLLRSLRGLPDTAIDLAIGGALKTFELRWPLVTMASLAGATAIAGQLPTPETGAELQAPKPVRLMPTLLAVNNRSAQTPKPGPEALQRDLDMLAEAFGETVGLAIVDISANWMVDVRGDMAFPQQSVSKLWVALTTLSAIDRGAAGLDDAVVLTEADRSVFNQPVSYLITPEGFPTTVEDLLRRALIESDNAANDKLMALAGGPGAVRRLLHEKGLEGISLAEDERHLQAHIAGLTWSSELAPYGAFNAARARLPTEARKAALEAYLSRPYDGARPGSVAVALGRLQAGDLLSKESTRWMLDTMARATTGPNRLKAGLPNGWRIAHKTGTGQDFQGGSIGINDVGLITAPDGRTYAVAVFLQRTHKPVSERLAFMQAVSQALVAHWEQESDKSPAAGPKESTAAD